MKYLSCKRLQLFLSMIMLFSAVKIVAEEELIVKMEVSKNRIDCKINPKIRDVYLKHDFFVQYDSEINLEELSYEILSMPVIMSIFSLVWFSGESFYVDSMDKDLFESFKKLKEMFRVMYPKSRWDGEIIPRKIVSLAPLYKSIHKKKKKKKGNKKALLFSGGLDSTSSFFAHKDEDLHLITACGMADTPLSKKNGWKWTENYVRSYAQMHGVSASFFRSSFYNMFNWRVVHFLYKGIEDWRYSTIESATWAGLTIPILIAKKCSTLYMAGSRNWYLNRTSAEHPFFVACLKFAGFSMVADQFEMTRHQKTESIVKTVNKNNYEKPFFKICSTRKRYPLNCGECLKCCALAISLISLGEDIRQYGFDCTDKSVVKNILKHMKVLQYSQIWRLSEIQIHAKKAVKGFPKRKKILKPFLDASVQDAKTRKGHLINKKINWNDLKRFAPQIEVPTDLSQELLDIEWGP